MVPRACDNSAVSAMARGHRGVGSRVDLEANCPTRRSISVLGNDTTCGKYLIELNCGFHRIAGAHTLRIMTKHIPQSLSQMEVNYRLSSLDGLVRLRHTWVGSLARRDAPWSRQKLCDGCISKRHLTTLHWHQPCRDPDILLARQLSPTLTRGGINRGPVFTFPMLQKQKQR